jgi:hypothetical protein
MSYRFGGKRKLLAIGVYPDVSLARARRTEARAQLADEVDTMQAKHEKEREAAAQAVFTFEAVATEWMGKQGGAPKTRQKKTGWLNNDV